MVSCRIAVKDAAGAQTLRIKVLRIWNKAVQRLRGMLRFTDLKRRWQRTVQAVSMLGVEEASRVLTPASTNSVNCSHLVFGKFHLLVAFVGIGSTGVVGIISKVLGPREGVPDLALGNGTRKVGEGQICVGNSTPPA
ncbi:unnamed protein product [Clavelina lepadiformis]|uniref:Uncharacterized protein n=1 Tax=Clavelina lepadiformis TaxID=159417 RepID=A0ABP0FCZ5_CLALP